MLRHNSPVSGTVNVLEGLAPSGLGLLKSWLYEAGGQPRTVWQC